MQLSTQSFADLMKPLPEVGAKFAVAVSGGADSLALCLLAHEWAQNHGKELVALSVDHGLRVESAQECLWVQQALKTRGISHHILVWEGEKPKSDIQAAARAARYGLMAQWCAEQGVADVFVAHHQDDQAETFLLRLARGSGVEGLSAMRPYSQQGGINLYRPLLSCPKASLIAYLKENDQDWIEDPSNRNEAYERVKIRQAREILSELGLTPVRLAQTAQAMARTRDVMARLCRDWLESYVGMEEAGYVRLDMAGLWACEDEIILRSLSRIGMAVAGGAYPPRFEKLQHLLKKLRQGEDATLMGCRWFGQENHVFVCREVRKTELKEKIYHIDNHHSFANVDVRLLGQEGWENILSHQPDLKSLDQPRPVIYAMVSFWDNEGVLAVPHLEYVRMGECFEAELTLIAKKRLFA
ncbi:tRNA lysidine(34) synthetase TilS [Terasakiella sp. SH-1]|uniref:tRNA lysidine(34) synthetase TilS n=1 Tax=Terasakiella sp. SH-1 TaxID=2560057 RepID=UPI0010738630|nr:tRNA lysidine(34) synthetase TilS [Terasakiella sp. SH-1]